MRTRLAGIALIVSGAALSVVSYRLALHERATAAAAAAAATRPAAESEAEAVELREIEGRARQAAAIAPLAAAVKLNVDAPTLLDLFENEEWWRAYREEFSFARLIVDGSVVATRATAS